MAPPAPIPVKKTNFKSIQLNKVKVEVDSDSDSDIQVFPPPVPSLASPGRSSVAAGQLAPRAPIRFGLLPVLSGGNATQISNLKKKPRDPNNNNNKGGKRDSQDQPGSGSSKAKGVEGKGEENGASAAASLPVQSPSTLPNNQLVPTNSHVSLIVKESRVVKGRLQPVQQPAATIDHTPAMQTMILPLVEARRENELNMEKNKGRIRRLEDDVDRLSKDKQRLEKDMDDLKRSMARREDRLDRQMNLLEQRLLCVEKGERKRKERKRGGSSDSDEARHKKRRH